MSQPDPKTTIVGDQWTPNTLMDACIHIRSLGAEVTRWRERAERAEAINGRLIASISQAFEELGDNDDAGAYLTLKHSGAFGG